MSQTKYTPGAWDVNEFTDLEGDHHVTVVAEWNGCPLAHMYEAGSETRANARLIAAAPELLEALQFVMSAHGEQLDWAFEQARAAIAKATGEQA